MSVRNWTALLEAEPYRPAWVADLGDQSIDLPLWGRQRAEQSDRR